MKEDCINCKCGSACKRKLTADEGVPVQPTEPTKSLDTMGLDKSQKCISSVKESTESVDPEGYHTMGLDEPQKCFPSVEGGLASLKNAGANKDLAFTWEERQVLGIHGLLPPRVLSQEEQIEHVLTCFERLGDNLEKYMYLLDLLQRNERLFYAFMRKYTEKALPVVYTPVVGAACQNFALVYRRPMGLFITIHDKGNVGQILKNWPEPKVRVICVTDGERILGLGDLGANGMGIPIGKLALYSAFGGVPPRSCLPITIDVGTNTEALLNDPSYLGLRQKRVRGKEYDELIDEFMKAVVHRWGPNTLIQFEDFGNANAFELLHRYRNTYCTYNDDIQGTAAVALAGLKVASGITKKPLSQNVYLFEGAGEAALGIADLLVTAMKMEGLAEAECRKRIWLFDSQGVVTNTRSGNLENSRKAVYSQNCNATKNLLEVVQLARPSVLIGASAQGGSFTAEILGEMANINDRPVVFALSNPTPKSECTAQDAYKHTGGKVIFASGSPFPPVEMNGRTYNVGQCNNCYVFPGIGLAIYSIGISTIKDEVFMVAADTLAGMVTEEYINEGRLIPPISRVRECSFNIAVALAEYAYEKDLAEVKPRPKDLKSYIRSCEFVTEYTPSVPAVYPFPENE